MIPLYIIRITNFEQGRDELIITNLQDNVDRIVEATKQSWPEANIEIKTQDIEKPFEIRQEY